MTVYGLTADNAYESSNTQRQDCMTGTDLRNKKVHVTLPKRGVPAINLKWKKKIIWLEKNGLKPGNQMTHEMSRPLPV